MEKKKEVTYILIPVVNIFLTQVYWYKNDVELDFSYISGMNRAENELILTVQPNDNEAVYRCEASNLVTPEPLKAEIKLIVQCKLAFTGSSTSLQCGLVHTHNIKLT